MFGVSLTIGNLKARSERHNHVPYHLKQCDRRKSDRRCEAKRIKDIENVLKGGAKTDFESVYKGS